MKDQISQEDLERLQEFESTILGLENKDIKYKEDLGIEKLVRKDYLVETYGNEIFEKMMGDLEYSLDDFLIMEKYIRFQKEADKLKNDPYLARIIFFRSLLPFYKPKMWWYTVSYLPNMFKRFQVSCALLRKNHEGTAYH